MSIPELRARIAKLDTDIDLQKKLVKTLEHDRKLVQRQLNAAIDPVARLPLEISSEIFLQSLPLFSEPRAGCVPMLLLNICHAWTDIALATPAIWSAIQVTFPCARGLKEILPIWLGRARNRPLSLSLQVKGQFDKDVVAIIWEHGQRLKCLEICELWRLDGEDLLGNASPSPGPLPSLETLTMRSDDSWAFSLPHVLALLQLAPNLVDCFFHDTDLVFDSDLDVGQVVLPKLRRLIFENQACPGFGGRSLQYLSLPRLEAFHIDITGGTLLPFLKRSSPPLLELVIREGLDFAVLYESLCLVPDLRRFEIWYFDPQAVKQLFVQLAQSPSLLPHASTLVIDLVEYDVPDLTDPFWTALVSALAARRTQFQVFRLIIPLLPGSKSLPIPDIVAALRELAVGGMQIYIGDTNEMWNIFD